MPYVSLATRRLKTNSKDDLTFNSKPADNLYTPISTEPFGNDQFLNKSDFLQLNAGNI